MFVELNEKVMSEGAALVFGLSYNMPQYNFFQLAVIVASGDILNISP